MQEFENNQGSSQEELIESEALCQETQNESAEMVEESVDAPESAEVLEDTKKTAKKDNFVQVFYDYLGTFCYALGIMVVLLMFVFRMVVVDGDSMKTTLEDKDRLIISNLFYSPETGDIVVIKPETKYGDNEAIIKRVIATEGQKVFIDYENWEVFVDDKKLDEPYIEDMKAVYAGSSMRPAEVSKYNEEFVVGEDMVFVMGDNRNNSLDSRSAKYGEINEDCILGRVIIRLSPHFGFVD